MRAKRANKNNNAKWQKLQGQKLSHIWLLLPLLAIMNYILGISTLSFSLSLLLLIENINVECETMLKAESGFKTRELIG